MDANGFVSSTGGGGTGTWQFIETKTAAASTTLTFNTSLSNFTELMFTWNGFTLGGNLFFNASADNGATSITGLTANLSNSANYTPLSSTSLRAALQAANIITGFMTIQNTPGMLPRIVVGQSFGPANNSGGGNILTIIGASNQINWVKFFPEVATFTGDINVFGR